MALRYVSVTAGVASESLNNQTALAAAVTTANAGVGTSGSVTTELAAMVANQPTGPVVVSVNNAVITTLAQLRQALDAAYNHFVRSNSFSA